MLSTEFLELLKSLITEIPPTDPPPADPPPDPPEKDEEEEEEEEEEEQEQMVPLADLRKIRSEAASHRKKAAAAQAELDALKAKTDKAASEAEIAKLAVEDQQTARNDLLQKDVATAQAALAASEAQVLQSQRENAVFAAAALAGFHNLKDAARLLDLTQIEVVDGVIDEELVNDMIDVLVESSPYLVASEDGDLENFGGPTNPGPKGRAPGPRFTSKDKIAQMKKQLADGIAADELTGQSLLDMRHKIRDAQRGVSVQAERDGRPIETNKQRLRRRTRED